MRGIGAALFDAGIGIAAACTAAAVLLLVLTIALSLVYPDAMSALAALAALGLPVAAVAGIIVAIRVPRRSIGMRVFGLAKTDSGAAVAEPANGPLRVVGCLGLVVWLVLAVVIAIAIVTVISPPLCGTCARP